MRHPIRPAPIDPDSTRLEDALEAYLTNDDADLPVEYESIEHALSTIGTVRK